MPKLLSHIPNSVKGNIIPLSREDYLRQQHQNYLKSQAEKGRKAVVEGREKFAKDYVIPAIKTVGSFTPAGPLIGLADAYNAYQEGNTGWAIAGAAAEALPYVGKGVSKVAKMIPGLGKDAPELAFHALNSDHWALHPSDLEGTTKDKLYLYQLALANRLMPIAKKTPIIKPIRKKAETIMSETPFFARHPQKTNYAKYNKQVGSFTGQIDGKPDRNLLKLYLYGDETGFTEAGEDVLTMDFGKRYKDLYPKAKYYIMDSAREHGRPIYGSNDDDLINLTEDSLSDIIKNKKRFRSSVGYANINPVKPIDNIAGHQIEIRGDLSTPTFVTQDLWKMNPLDYSKKYSKKLGVYNNNYGKLLLEKQAGLLDKVGNPFYFCLLYTSEAETVLYL